MAVTLKTDTEDIPSILGLFGLGGLPKTAEGTDPQAQPQAPQGGGGASQWAWDMMTKPQDEQSGAIQVPVDPPNKIDYLRAILGHGQAPVDTQGADASSASGISPYPVTPVPQTFAQRHPTLSKILGVTLNMAKGAAAGAGSSTFGEGYGKAQELPLQVQGMQLENQGKQATIAHQQAVTDSLKNTVQVRDPYGNPYAIPQAQLPGFLKTNITETGKGARLDKTEQGKTDRDKSKNAIALRKQGLTLDDSGNQVPIAYDDLSPSEQAHIDLAHAQIEAQQATAELKKSENDRNSPRYQLAMGRLQTARQNAATAMGRLGLEKNKYLADYFGTDSQGNALPGVTKDESGNPVGPRVANAGKIPADRLKRGDLAQNAISNLDDIRTMIQDNPDLFGSMSGRITSVKEMLGSDNEVIRQIAIAAHNYALASAGVHGTRSQGAVQKTEDELLNHWKDGPNAVIGGINQAQKSLNQFVGNQRLGSRPIPASGAAAGGQPKTTHKYDPSTGKINPVSGAK